MRRLLQSSVNWIPVAMRQWIKYIPGVAAAQRWLVDRILSKDRFIHTINAGPASGLRFEVSLPQDKAIWVGTYESEFAGAISRGIVRDCLCYDVGGYRGYMAGVMAVGGARHTFVFEPLPANVRILERFVELNPSYRISVVPVGIGKSDGTAKFKIMADASMGKLAASGFQPEAPVAGEFEVSVRSLDSLVEKQEIQPPGLIKIDVEGSELQVLNGASNVIRKFRPKLFIEAHSSQLAIECTEFLQLLNYRVHQLERGEIPPEATRHLVATAE